MVGGCLCGQVRYAALAEPAIVGVCHCTECQKQAGTAFTIFVAVPRSSITMQGAHKTYRVSGSSGGEVSRHFCPNCGSPLTTEAAASPQFTMIKGGTLDDRSWLRPTVQIYCDSAQPWLELGGEMRRFGKARV